MLWYKFAYNVSDNLCMNSKKKIIFLAGLKCAIRDMTEISATANSKTVYRVYKTDAGPYIMDPQDFSWYLMRWNMWVRTQKIEWDSPMHPKDDVPNLAVSENGRTWLLVNPALHIYIKYVPGRNVFKFHIKILLCFFNIYIMQWLLVIFVAIVIIALLLQTSSIFGGFQDKFKVRYNKELENLRTNGYTVDIEQEFQKFTVSKGGEKINVELLDGWPIQENSVLFTNKDGKKLVYPAYKIQTPILDYIKGGLKPVQ